MGGGVIENPYRLGSDFRGARFDVIWIVVIYLFICLFSQEGEEWWRAGNFSVMEWVLEVLGSGGIGEG